MVITLETDLAVSKLYVSLSHDSAIPLPGFYPREKKTYMH